LRPKGNAENLYNRVGFIINFLNFITMKKLLSFLAVAVIVTSAFAFTSKKTTRLCADLGTGCKVQGVILINPSSGDQSYDPNWDGIDAHCTVCPTPATITGN
jgi:hypothetical protein